jgi:hypothetical protein
MRHQPIALLLVLAALLLTACSQDTVTDEVTPQPANQTVAFGYYAARTATTRAQSGAATRAQTATFVDGTTNKTIPEGQRVGVFGFYQGQDKWAPKKFTADFMYNQPLVAGTATEVTEKGADGKTDTTVVRCALSYDNDANQKYWPNTPGDKLAFIAYYPWMEAPAEDKLATLDTYIQPVFTKNGGIGSFRFKMAPDTKDQLDFMVSDSVVNQTKPGISSRVRLTFHHALAAITASVTMAQDLIKVGAKIANIRFSLTGVRSQGTCHPVVDSKGKMTFTWDDIITDATFEATATSTDEDNKEAERTLLMIPQPLSTAVLTVTYDIEFHETVDGKDYVSYSYRDNTATFNLGSASSAAGVASWQSGLRYNYNVIVSLTGINFLPSIRQWTTGTMETDLNQNP